MKYMSRFVLGFFALVMIVSFQNCGQSGVIGLESKSELAKLDGGVLDPQTDVTSDVVIVDPDQVVPSTDDQAPSTPSTDDPTSPVVDNPTSPVVDDPMSPVVEDPMSPVVIDNPPTDGNNSGTDEGTVSHGSITHEDGVDDGVDVSLDDPDFVIDEDDGSIVKGPRVSCAGLNKLAMTSGALVESSDVESSKNTKGPLKITNKEMVSVDNHKGILILLRIKNIISLKNIKSTLLSADADVIGKVDNVKALSLMSADSVSSIKNYKGLLCLNADRVNEIDNFKGILEVTGNVKKITNFKGILKVKGNIESLENFKGILKVDGDILSQKNVKVKLK